MLYEEFRPQKFSDVIGQGATPEILRNQVLKNKLGHSYLMVGNRGSGKTTSARILAKAANCLHPVNGEPCGKCENCKRFDNKTMIDVIEIDAASNNGVDNIRNIISDMQYGPQIGKYKIYIIDEAHMLSQGASNAFLKTLEEPPTYGIFILCTTDPQKLPITILSRCQRFDFKRIQVSDIIGRLRYVVKEKKFNIDDRALHLIAKLADGAMRDALSLLEQAVSIDTGNGVSYQEVVEMLGVSTNEKILNLISCCIKRNTIDALNELNNIVNEGKDLNIFLQELIKNYRNVLIAKVNSNCESLINASDEDIKVYKSLASFTSTDTILHHIRILQDCEKDFKLSSNQRTLIEMAIVKMTGATNENLLLKKIEELQQYISNMLMNIPTGTVISSIPESTTNKENNEETLSMVENDVYEAEIAIVEKIRRAKEYVIEKIRAANKNNLADVLESTELSLEDNVLYIVSNENDCEILIANIRNLTKGFSKALNMDVNVEIIIN